MKGNASNAYRQQEKLVDASGGHVAQIIFGDGGARLPARDLSESQPQHVGQPQNPWNFVRSFGNPGGCEGASHFLGGRRSFSLTPGFSPVKGH
jgi:hypothetical protein